MPELSTDLGGSPSADAGDIPVYETIPIPPRRERPRNGAPRVPDLGTTPQLRHAPQARACTPEPASEGRGGDARDFLISVFVAITANLLLVFLFLVMTLKVPLSPGDDFIRVHRSENEPTRPREVSRGGSEVAGSLAATPSGGGSGTAAAAFVVTADAAELPLPTAFEVPAFFKETRETDSHEALPEPMSLGASLSHADFEEAEHQYRERAERFAKGRGRRGPNGKELGVETITSIFEGSPSVDGSGMVIFVDVSGSMKRISKEVAAFVSAQFPKSGLVEITGCAIRSHSCRFVTQLDRVARRGEHTDFYFFCDLQDGQSEAGVAALLASLRRGGLPRALHVISFDQPAKEELQSLTSETRGSFQLIETAWQ